MGVLIDKNKEFEFEFDLLKVLKMKIDGSKMKTGN